MTDADSADNLALRANTAAKTESLLHRLEHGGRGMSLNVYVNKTETMCFKQEGTIFRLSGKPLKLVGKFTYLGGIRSFTKSEIVHTHREGVNCY